MSTDPKIPRRDEEEDDDFDFKRLLLRSPVEEFTEYARLRLRAAERLGDEEFDSILEAVELGKKLLGGEDE